MGYGEGEAMITVIEMTAVLRHREGVEGCYECPLCDDYSYCRHPDAIFTENGSVRTMWKSCPCRKDDNLTANTRESDISGLQSRGRLLSWSSNEFSPETNDPILMVLRDEQISGPQQPYMVTGFFERCRYHYCETGGIASVPGIRVLAWAYLPVPDLAVRGVDVKGNVIDEYLKQKNEKGVEKIVPIPAVIGENR